MDTQNPSASLESRFCDVDGMTLHYSVAGPAETAPVLLLHGWPTSAFLWRRVMPAIAETRRVVALDLPGFGLSAKPLDASYSLRFFERVLNGVCEHLDAERIGLAVHDLGGPAGLYWASRHPQRLERLAVLNTLVYPQLSWAVMAFVAICRMPGLRWWLTSPRGLAGTLKLGVHDASRLAPDAVPGIQAPFADPDARRALIKTALGIHPNGLKDIAAWLPKIDVPVCLLYGRHDRILPDIAKTMERLKRDVPHAELHEPLDCGHFLQEEQPEKIGRILGDFFA